MNINWKIRMKNKVWLTALFSAAVSFVFDLQALFDIAPALTQEGVMSALSALLTLLTALGVVIDPTTPGVQDVSQKC